MSHFSKAELTVIENALKAFLTAQRSTAAILKGVIHPDQVAFGIKTTESVISKVRALRDGRDVKTKEKA